MTWEVISTLPNVSVLPHVWVGWLLCSIEFLRVCALPLGFQGKLRILRTMFIHAAVHGVEPSFVLQSSVTKLRAAFVVWSRGMPLAHTGAVLNLLDGPAGGDPGFQVRDA